MDNETTKCMMPSNSIERIVIFISDIFEKIMFSDEPPFIIKSKQLTKQGINYLFSHLIKLIILILIKMRF